MKNLYLLLLTPFFLCNLVLAESPEEIQFSKAGDGTLHWIVKDPEIGQKYELLQFYGHDQGLRPTFQIFTYLREGTEVNMSKFTPVIQMSLEPGSSFTWKTSTGEKLRFTVVNNNGTAGPGATFHSGTLVRVAKTE